MNSAVGKLCSGPATRRWFVERWRVTGAFEEAARRRRMHAPTSMDTWSGIEISPEIALSVRGVTDDDAGLLEKVGKKLRQLINRRPRRRR